MLDDPDRHGLARGNGHAAFEAAPMPEAPAKPGEAEADIDVRRK